MAISKLLTLTLLLGGATAQAREAASPASCQAAAAQPVIAGAKEALDEDPADLATRLTLADAWSDAGCFTEALTVLQGGEAAHPRDKELQTRLQVAKSLVTEQGYFDSMDRAAKDAKLSRALFRCNKLTEISSCDDALGMKPNDPDVLVVKGDTLFQLKRPGEAIVAYRSALVASADPAAVHSKISAAESQRRALLETCQSDVGAAALRACESASLPGAPDEAGIYRRRGLLLQADNQLSPALDAYMAAERLRPGDHGAALAIVSLSGSTGRKDALTLAARGAAFMTLGQPADAIEPLRQALRLEPDLIETKNQLRAAEHAKEPEKRLAQVAKLVPSSPVTAALNEPPGRLFSNDAPASRSN